MNGFIKICLPLTKRVVSPLAWETRSFSIKSAIARVSSGGNCGTSISSDSSVTIAESIVTGHSNSSPSSFLCTSILGALPFLNPSINTRSTSEPMRRRISSNFGSCSRLRVNKSLSGDIATTASLPASANFQLSFPGLSMSICLWLCFTVATRYPRFLNSIIRRSMSSVLPLPDLPTMETAGNIFPPLINFLSPI